MIIKGKYLISRSIAMPSDTISYSDKYDDDHFEYRDRWNKFLYFSNLTSNNLRDEKF